MTSERWQQIKRVLNLVQGSPPPDRPAIVAGACGPDQDLRREVESFLRCEARAEVLEHLAGLPLRTTADRIGQTVSHYRISEMLGGGGMGRVYRAEDLRLGRQVALKFLPEEMAADPAALRRFEREARAASALNHPNICTIHEIEEHAGQPFIVMELLEGQTLRDRIRGAPLPVAEVVALATQIAEGLEAAHGQGIIHRDIKPANIFVSRNHQAKILDFGLAKLQGHEIADSPERNTAGHDLNLTLTGAAMGTAAYMSPEQVRGEKLDARSDLFSFGLVLYEMATGAQAFPGWNASTVGQAILSQAPARVRELRSELPPRLAEVIDKALQKDRGARFQHASEMRADLERVRSGKQSPRMVSWRHAMAGLFLLAAAAGTYLYFHRVPKVTAKNPIVLADFTSNTNDSAFDATLKQGLAMQLKQSASLELISERKVNETLKLMCRPVGDRLTPEITREVCQRAGGKAMLTGSIAGIGTQYVVGLKALNCDTGDLLAEAQERAAGKQAVLKALDRAAAALRGKLGQTIGSVQMVAVPLEEVTTPSLEALKAYSLARKTYPARGYAAALPLFQRAVELDANFAMPYAVMARAFNNTGQVNRAQENARKAYALRGNASERERFAIESVYYAIATGELEKAARVYQLWQQVYPTEAQTYRDLGYISNVLGDRKKGLEEHREALRLEPGNELNYTSLVADYAGLNRLDEAEAVLRQADERKLEGGEHLLEWRYYLAFLKGDTARMTQGVSAAVVKPGADHYLLDVEADTEAWYGKLNNARELMRQAMDSARRIDARETAAVFQASLAVLEAEVGEREFARADAVAAVNLSLNFATRQVGALALARAGDTAKAARLASEIDRTLPLATVAHREWLPMIRAAIALERRDPNRAIELLQVTEAIELGGDGCGLCPAYLRGQAYLMLRDGNRAEAEFQKLIDHPGLVLNSIYGALARLGLARALALDSAKDSAARGKARAAYRDFLNFWKDADPGLPILKQAQAESAKLQ